MSIGRWTRVLLGVLALSVPSSFATAQAPVIGTARPPSRLSGYSGTELENIYRESVGEGYSASSLNQIALNNARAQVGYYGQQTTRQASSPQIGLGLGQLGAGRSKPFSNYNPAPTVSPYLNLFREDFDGNSDLNYQTLVRPIIQQQEVNRQLQRQNTEIARRIQAISAQNPFNPEGSKQQFPTGHKSTFMYYGHYYPSANVRPQQR